MLNGTNGTLATSTTAGIQTLIPIGNITMWSSTGGFPANYFHCNGAWLSRTTYANLFSVIGTIYGAGDGSTTFAIPDFRGLFPRGLDAGRGIDSGRNLSNTLQDHSIQSHNHIVGGQQETLAGGGAVRYSLVNAPGSVSFGSGHTGTAETRPKNLAVYFLIKFA